MESDYFAESCYQQYQADPESIPNTKLNWEKTLGALAQRFPDVRLLAAEYGPMQRELNDVLFNLPVELVVRANDAAFRLLLERAEKSEAPSL